MEITSSGFNAMPNVFSIPAINASCATLSPPALFPYFQAFEVAGRCDAEPQLKDTLESLEIGHSINLSRLFFHCVFEFHLVLGVSPLPLSSSEWPPTM